MTDHDDPVLADEDLTGEDDAEDTEDESLLDHLRGSGVGLEDPNIVGDPTPLVDEHVAEDDPPQV